MKQKGQGIVEFAVIVPILVALGCAIIYVGIMFLDYTQYNNAARDAARDIALQLRYAEGTGTVNAANRSISAQRQYLVDAINGGTDHEKVVSRYQHPYTNIYEPVWSAKFLDINGSDGGTTPYTANEEDVTITDVEVSISLKLAKGAQSKSYLADWGILPSELKPITYKMVLEEANLVNYAKDTNTTNSGTGTNSSSGSN